MGNFDVNKKPTYGSVIIGTESRDISSEIYMTLARCSSWLSWIIPFVTRQIGLYGVFGNVVVEYNGGPCTVESRIELSGFPGDEEREIE